MVTISRRFVELVVEIVGLGLALYGAQVQFSTPICAPPPPSGVVCPKTFGLYLTILGLVIFLFGLFPAVWKRRMKSLD
ncbi:MAG TPA: hypothetical protein VGS11_07295 [Candidatus Bathyarchaeia archaeon]|nr:hypothetical protein [Candidatus Bathyarchaeia archaeon]